MRKIIHIKKNIPQSVEAYGCACEDGMCGNCIGMSPCGNPALPESQMLYIAMSSSLRNEKETTKLKWSRGVTALR